MSNIRVLIADETEEIEQARKVCDKLNIEHYVIDWAHVTEGNSASDVATTYLLFAINGKQELADKYLNMFSEKSGMEKSYIQKWLPIVAAAQKTKGKPEEQGFLEKWIDIFDFQ